MIIIKNHKCNLEKLRKDYPNAFICDVTSHAKDELIKLSPFYPHGGIPVPFSPGWKAMSVESVWQGLKDYESVGTDYDLFKNTTMKNLKRTTRKYGRLKGHRKGVGSPELLGYVDARKILYLPTYKWVLDNKAHKELEKIKTLSRSHDVILLDYATNPDVENPAAPLSHAALIKAYIEGHYPIYEESEEPVKANDWEGKFQVGQLVKHPTFGLGTVKHYEGERITVLFETVGEKLLALKYARLQTAEYGYSDIKNGGDNLIRVCRDVNGESRWGFMDRNGKEVIPCRYDKVDPFSNGLAQVGIGKDRFFINEKGETVFCCNDEYSYGLFDGERCEIHDWDDNYRGFVNREGEIILPLIEINSCETDYKEGLHAWDYDYGESPTEYTNEKGNVVIVARDLDFYNGLDFRERLAVASHTKYGRYGYLDQRGQVVIPFEFTNAALPDHGMLPVSIEGNWGFLDRDCNWLIPPHYRNLTGFWAPAFDKEGIALVYKNGEGAGAINRAGEEVVPFRFKSVARMDGYIAALTEDGMLEWYDMSLRKETSEYVYTFNYDDYPFRKVAKLLLGELRWGFIDNKGREVIPCLYNDCMVLDGFARVKKDDLWAFVTPNGSFLTEFAYQSAFAEFSEGLSAIQRNGLWGFINERGEEVVPSQYDAVTDLKQGRSMVLLDEKYGYIDPDGKEITPLIYDMAKPFSDDLAWVRRGAKAGSINRNGMEVIPCRYDVVGECSEGLVAVCNRTKKTNHYMILNTQGEVVVDFADTNLEGLSDFKEGLCGIKKNGNWGFIDRTGKEVIPCKYSWPYFNMPIQFSHGLCIFRSPEHWRLIGCINKYGKVVIPPDYLYITWEDDGKWAANNGNEIHYYNLEGKRIYE